MKVGRGVVEAPPVFALSQHEDLPVLQLACWPLQQQTSMGVGTWHSLRQAQCPEGTFPKPEKTSVRDVIIKHTTSSYRSEITLNLWLLKS